LIRNPASEKFIERLKMPVLANGGVIDPKSKVMLMSVEGNFKEIKGHCP